MIPINGVLVLMLGLLYLFAKPTYGNRPNGTQLLLVGGLAVAVLAAVLASMVEIAFAVVFYALSAAVVVKTLINWRNSRGLAAAKPDDADDSATWERRR